MKILLSKVAVGVLALAGCSGTGEAGLGDIARTAQSGVQSCTTIEGVVVTSNESRAPVRCGPQSQAPIAGTPGN